MRKLPLKGLTSAAAWAEAATPLQIKPSSELPSPSPQTESHWLDDPFIGNLIRHKVANLCQLRGFSRSDTDDIEQELRIALLIKMPQYDPARGTREAFVTVVIESAALMAIRQRRSKKANLGVAPASLDTTSVSCGGDFIPLGSLLTEADGRRRTRRTGPSVIEQCDMLEQFHQIDKVMTDDDRRLMKIVVDDGVCAAARKRGVTRRQIEKQIEEIRLRAIKARTDARPTA